MSSAAADGSPSFLERARVAVREEAKGIGRAFLRPFIFVLGAGALFGLVLGIGSLVQDGAPSLGTALLFPVVGTVYGVMLAVPWAAVWGVLGVIWRLAGFSILVPLILIPLTLAGSFWLMGGVLGEALTDWVRALVEAGAEHEWLGGASGGGHAGFATLIILLPMLVWDLGVVVLDPSALLALLWLFLALVLTVALGTIPSSAFSLVVVLVVVVRRYVSRAKPGVDPGNEAASVG